MFYDKIISKNLLNNLLICMALISFGFFGSLSHIFTLTLITITLFQNFYSNKWKKLDENSLILFFALTGCFFFLLLNSIFHESFGSALSSLGPMYPIPLIGLLILFTRGSNAKLSAKHLSLFAQLSILILLSLYLLFLTFWEVTAYEYENAGEIEMLSGNPMPFSFAVIGISIFCIFGWKTSSKKQRLMAIFCFVVGIYFACYASGSRTQMLSFLIILPYTLFYLSSSLGVFLTYLFMGALAIGITWIAHIHQIVNIYYLTRIERGLEALFLADTWDTSIVLRLEVWAAAFKSISEAPILGHGVSDRFNALFPHLRQNFELTFTHAHNDILTSTIAAGYVAGFLAITAITAPLLAVFLSNESRSEKLYFGTVIMLITLFTAGFGTVFFNDITSAWLAFSTYLIWNTDFSE